MMGLRLSLFAVAALTVQSLSAAEPGMPLDGVESFESSLSVRSTLQNSVHRCASDGESVWCWGSNEQGQLGNSGRAGTELATPIETLPRRIDDLAVGGQHTCVVAEERLFCWGDNRFSQLGVEGQVPRRTPVEVLPGVGFLSVDAGTYHSCAVTTDDRVLCWGWNAYGQAGIDSSLDIVAEPTEVMLRSGVELALGGAHSCALSDGLVECWGRNDFGQLGDGGLESRAAPAAVVDLPSGIERLASASAHSCAASNDKVWCWGSNRDAQTGRPYDASDPATQSTPRPFPVAALSGEPGDLALDGTRSCVAVGETMRCWGRVSPWPADPQPEPIELWRAANLIQDSDEPECARVDGSIVCINGSGRGEVSSAFRAARVDGLRPLSLEPDQRADLIVGPLNGCAQYDQRELRCWGANGFGQLGQGSNGLIEGSVEMSFPGNPIVHDLDFGVFHACAVTSGGLFCWGNNFFGQLGLPGDDDRLEPTAVPIGVDSDTRLAAGFSFTCLWSPGTDTLFCFGDPPFAVDAGQASVPLEQPRTVSLGDGSVRDVVAGREHLCALIDDAGETLVRCLGRIRTEPDYDGRRSLRDLSTGLNEIESLSASGFSSCAQSGSEVVCWGLDHTWPAVSRGPNRAPFQVEFPAGDEFAGRAEGFSLGGRHACVAGRTGELVCIGLPRVQACTFREATGDLGSGSGLAACLEAEATELTDEELGWLPIEGGPSIAPDAIASGEEFTCARIGRWIRCWGRGARGFAPPPDSESPVTPVLRPAVLEPSGKVPVDLDSGSSCPAFVIARVSLLEPEGERTAGAWGVEMNLRQGLTRLQGGLNFGGYANTTAAVPGYAAFRIDSADGEPRRVTLRMQGDPGTYAIEGETTVPGSGVRELAFEFTLDLSEVPTERTVTLGQGFHIIRIIPPPGGPKLFQVSALASRMDGGPASFRYGAVVGGYLEDGLLGYTALCTDDARRLDVRTEGANQRGPIGAGDLRLQIENLTRGEILFDSINKSLPR